MLTGTVAAINSFISGGNVDYTTAADDTTAQTLTVSIDDGGNTGSGGPKTDTETVTINVTAVNDAPVLTVPGSITIDEDVTTALTGISVADVDAGTGNITVTLSVPGGTLAATGTPGVVVGGTATALTLTGTLADINAFLGGSNVTYATALNNDGESTLTITGQRQRQHRHGGDQTETARSSPRCAGRQRRPCGRRAWQASPSPRMSPPTSQVSASATWMPAPAT